MKRKYQHVIITICASIANFSNVQAVSAAFGDAIGGPITLPDGVGGTFTMETTVIQSTGAVAGPNHGFVGEANIGGTYDGLFFDSQIDATPGNTTRLQALPGSSIGGGGPDFEFIGFRVDFSVPIPIYTFGFVDLDAGEWSGSWAHNSSTDTIGLPTIKLDSVTSIANDYVVTPSAEWATDSEYPASFTGVRDAAAIPGNVDPDTFANQVTYDFEGGLYDSLYFVWGVDIPGGSGSWNSGVTGLTLVDPIPEPSTAILGSLAGLALLVRRRRA